jgi:hypothetical protein
MNRKRGNTISLLRAEITTGDYPASKTTTLGDLEASRLRTTDTTHNLSRNRRRRGQWKSKRKTIIQNMAYAQQSQKLETGTKIIADLRT